VIRVQNIVILDDARNDLFDGKSFYDVQSLGVGDYFWDSLISDIESLYIHAGVHELHFNCFRMLSKRFPYAIYYQIKSDTIQVIAILPIKRDPNWICKRMNN
jgi:hypothetical protein